MSSFRTRYLSTARTPKPCGCGCGQPILPGEPQMRTAGKWDGDFYSFIAHADCDTLREELFGYVYGDEGLPFNISEILTEYTDGVPDAQGILDALRGYLPRAVCRQELRLVEWLALD